MYRIVCTGDSHTWGQGATGLEQEFDPVWVGGELRLASFQADFYVNLLRRKVNAATGSYAAEWTAQELGRLDGARFEAPCAWIGRKGIDIPLEGGLVRVECRKSIRECGMEILIDGQSAGEWDLTTDNELNAWRLITLHPGDGRHVLSIRARAGEVGLYRVEAYGGGCAVVNSGIGSCPVGRLYTDYWVDYVEALRPDLVLMEAHTINDWLTGDTPEAYCDRLTEVMENVKRLGAVPVLMTVAPIGGAQILPGLAAEYEEFVEASRKAARRTGVRLCDANELMKIAVGGMTDGEMSRYLLADNWHPNDRGHAMYAQLLYEAIASEKWF